MASAYDEYEMEDGGRRAASYTRQSIGGISRFCHVLGNYPYNEIWSLLLMSSLVKRQPYL